MEVLISILLSVIVVSLISLVGIVTFAHKKILKNALRIIVGFAAGAMAGAAFLVLLPEAVSTGSSQAVFFFLLLGIIAFFVLENFLHWYHCHRGNCDLHRFTYLSIIADAAHNFLDGMVIAASYLVAIPLGVVTTIAVIAHEIPHEVGTFGVLVYGGFTKWRALFYNFLSALTAIVGAVFVYMFKFGVGNYYALLVAFAAGNFIYIATSDLIPELHKEEKIKKSALQLILFLLGVAVIWLVQMFFAGG